ncbi:longitudinals lacking protein, isoforms H/M/V isoform X1 [Hyalella azteca]|uniref:Longitudinals lacking protein, isoforms H/M/V isoform X1 n=1 Tax=Hyalella azteca TaxID=294128 RepID=A0A8B7PAI5_HYAAZ|nr:longitudinals lacking protein, isoforms H/M/V isoform X1 [Hyalella azteca]
MAELLSLKWNNHKSTFFHVLSTIRAKESYSDVTLACDGRFYSLHKFVLSTCSEYFEEMFERTQCKHPVIVLKDINSEDLEALLNYMYVGEVNVVQEKLAGLIKAAECLKIKGLAVPDEDPMESKDNSSIGREQHKRSQRGEDSPRAKRRRRENSSDVSEEILSPVRSRPSGRSRDHHHHHHHHGSHNAESAPVAPSGDNEDGTRETQGLTDASEEAENSPSNAKRRADTSSNKASSTQTNEEKARKQEAIPEENVKAEPVDSEADGDDCTEVPGELEDKTSLHQALGLDVDDESEFIEDTSLLEPPQTMEEVVAEVIPGSAEYQANSFLWEGDGSLSGLPTDSFTSDSSHPRQIVWALNCAPLQNENSNPHLLENHQVLDDVLSSQSLPSDGGSVTSISRSSGRSMRSMTKNSRGSSSSNAMALSVSGPPVFASSASYKCKFCSMRYQSETYVRKHVLRKHKEKLSDYAPVASKAVALASSNASTITTSGFSVVSSCTQVESTNKVPVRRCSTSLRSQSVATRVRPIRPKTNF